ncbi:DUF3352 domain-containing protein [Cytophagaceae bacterium ABcell3]|nr:DUF3352 domain-containing protein [Cytophagaceae bacterium ABcell3]
MKKVSLYVLLPIFSLSCLFYYIFYLSPSDNFRAIYLVPDNAVYIIQSDEPVKSWKKVRSSDMWKHMQQQPYFAELTSSANSLDSLVRDNEMLFDMLGSRSVTVSAHVYAPRKYDFLFIADLEKASKLKFVQDYFTNLGGGGYKITERDYHGHRVYEFYDKEDHSTLYLTFIRNLLVCSYVGKLVEASIDQQEEPVIGRDVNFVEMKQQVSKNGLFNVYVQYSRLNEFMSCYLAGEDEYVNALSNAIFYTGLNVNLQNNQFITKGYTNINDTASSYLKAMLLSGKGNIAAADVIPQRTAYYLSLAVDNFDDFYERFVSLLQENKQDYQEYEDNVNRIEKFLKINIREHFIGWMGNEVAFVQTQPKVNGRENEFSVIIKASDRKDAVENLSFIAKQIRKKTPVKFKEIEYNGYPINYLSMKGMFRLVLGSFFEKLDKPYYTVIDDYVIFSNHPQTLKNIIDDYKSGETLGNSASYKEFFESSFDQSSNVFVYVQPPMLYKGLQGFVSHETWVNIGKNKDYITCFPQLAFQMNEKKEMFETKLVCSFAKPEAKPLFFQANDKQVNVPMRPVSEEEEEDDDSDEIYLDDLDAKKYTETFDNGTLKLKVNIKNGIRHGSYHEYYPDGTIKVKGRYKNDLRDGTFKYYNKNGKLVEKKSFSKGEEVD